ncbi:hypothetical protein HDU83_000407 [Entophlyctis luteolus]|nr:hypothetical protein HDU83_000407 [Entophlyctis luteolus]
MAAELSTSHGVLRRVLDKLALTESAVKTLKAQVDELSAQAQLAACRRVESASSCGSAKDSAPINGTSALYQGPQLPPVVAATVAMPVPSVQAVRPAETISKLKRARTQTTTTTRESAKRLRTNAAHVGEFDTKQQQQPQQQPVSTSPTHAIDAFVTKSGTGESRVVTCNYCRSRIFSKHRPRWEKHIALCLSAPKSIRLQFGGAELGQVAPATNTVAVAADCSIDAAVVEQQQQQAPLASAADITDIPHGSLGINDLINQHVEKHGVGPRRVVTCIYCRRAVESDHKKKWQQHVATCQRAPREVQLTFSVALVRKTSAASTTYASDASITPAPAHTSTQGAEAITDANHYIPATKSAKAENGILAPYPCPPEPVLPNGQPNTEGWRAWTDIVRYQRPDVVIEAKTGINVTKFKRQHNLAEIRMYPRTSARRTHSSMCSAIPERLTLEFLAFMDPTFAGPKTPSAQFEMHMKPSPTVDKAQEGQDCKIDMTPTKTKYIE